MAILETELSKHAVENEKHTDDEEEEEEEHSKGTGLFDIKWSLPSWETAGHD